MSLLLLPELALSYEQGGDPSAAPVVLLHGIGMAADYWDPILHRLSAWRVIRPEMRGHGASGLPDGTFGLGALVRDVEAVLDALGVRDAVVLGHGLGGLVAQALAVKRLDLVRGLILSHTAARLPLAADLRQVAEGTAPLADTLLPRAFARKDRTTQAAQNYAAMLARTDATAGSACLAAQASADLYTTTATLTLPTHIIAGMHDALVPPDLAQETTDLIRGASYTMLRNSGHASALDAPDAYADEIIAFLHKTGH
ncbi:alpha/beta fold hydrolase [Falsirhodobacter sp. alg1]|uniref:alpha/beta fold hydrolase n=1 Tax=Falsirhodobacter sp. alg1 TaxID=1472418 RepID=UPI0005EE6E96|nr:alpha/beta hydrolase [Falsirhodobacter sp. alg1]